MKYKTKHELIIYEPVLSCCINNTYAISGLCELNNLLNEFRKYQYCVTKMIFPFPIRTKIIILAKLVVVELKYKLLIRKNLAETVLKVYSYVKRI